MLTVVLFVIFVPQVLFAALYGLTRRWWKTPEGAALFFSSVGWSLVSGGFLVDLHMLDVSDMAWLLVGVVAASAACLKFLFLARAIAEEWRPRIEAWRQRRTLARSHR